MTQFKKGISVKGRLPSDYPVVDSSWYSASEVNSTEVNKRSLAEVDQVLDDIIAYNPEWAARLQRIIEESK